MTEWSVEQRHIEGRTGEGSDLINVQLSAEETYADVRPAREVGAVSAAVSISRGCNNMCSFCIVPFTRGRERSRPAKSILDEVLSAGTDLSDLFRNDFSLYNHHMKFTIVTVPHPGQAIV